MTFYEAAVEVLRGAGRPLHVKKITAISVDKNLLTHVGRDPEKTMRARLSQEIAKTADSLVRSIRPNIYALREGVDATDARQTVQPRKVDHLEDHIDDALISANNEGDNQDKKRADSKSGRNDKKHGDKKQDKKSRNQKARGDDKKQSANGRDEKRSNKKQDKKQSAHARDEKRGNQKRDDQRDKNTRSDNKGSDNKKSRSTQSRSGQPRIAPSEAAKALAQLRQQANDETPAKAGDLAAHIHDILEEASGGLLLEEIGAKLADTAYAALPKLPLQALRSTLTRANQLRADKGQPPLFTASTDGRWSLIEEDAALTASLDILKQWQKQHTALLARHLEHVIAERSNDQLLGIVALVMERLGYEDVELHPAEGDEVATFSGTLAQGLSESRVAVRLFSLERPITRLDIMAFRGNLHQYNAERGAIFTLGGHSLCARQQVNAPNAAPITLLQDSKLAELMIRTHVGTAEVKVSVPDLDHAFFQ